MSDDNNSSLPTKRRGNVAGQSVLGLISGAWLLFSLVPIWLVFSAVFSSSTKDMTRVLFPSDFGTGMAALREAWTTVKIGGALFDTFTYSVIVVIGMAVISTLAAYELSFYQFPGRRLIFACIMGTMMLPPVLYVVPLYREVFSFGLADTFLGVAAPFIAFPLCVFILMQFMEQLPREFLEAARIDGAGHFHIFYRIVVPLCRNGILTSIILLFITIWGEYLWPSLVTSQNVQALSVLIANMFNPNFYVDPRVRFAAMLVAIVPPVLLYVVFQRLVIRGVTASGVKG